MDFDIVRMPWGPYSKNILCEVLSMLIVIKWTNYQLNFEMTWHYLHDKFCQLEYPYNDVGNAFFTIL